MRVVLNEKPKLKIVRFVKGLAAIIANKVEVQPYLSCNDVCNLAIKVDKQLKGWKSFPTCPNKSRSTHSDSETPPHKSKLTGMTH